MRSYATATKHSFSRRTVFVSRQVLSHSLHTPWLIMETDNLGAPTQIPVFTGIWTNWSHGKVYGATITLSKRDSNLLVAVIALFVAFAGEGFSESSASRRTCSGQTLPPETQFIINGKLSCAIR